MPNMHFRRGMESNDEDIRLYADCKSAVQTHLHIRKLALRLPARC